MRLSMFFHIRKKTYSFEFFWAAGWIFNCSIFPNSGISRNSQFLFFLFASKQAWAKIIYVGAIIYLNMKKLHARAEIFYNNLVYSLDFYSGTKKFLVPTWDLEIGLIVLGEGLAICQWIKF
jgi:hypothetical protein